MSWVRLDDGFPDNGKVENLSDRAFRLYITGLCLSARKLTDGHLTRKDLAVLYAHTGAKKQHTTELANAGLWRLEDGGAVINDFLTYNPPKAKVELRRAAAKARMAALRGSREQNANGEANEDANLINPQPQPQPQAHVVLSAEKDFAAKRLMGVLSDADEHTETTVRRLIQAHRLSVGDIEYARECATGPGVRSPAAVAVAELKRRAAA